MWSRKWIYCDMLCGIGFLYNFWRVSIASKSIEMIGLNSRVAGCLCLNLRGQQFYIGDTFPFGSLLSLWVLSKKNGWCHDVHLNFGMSTFLPTSQKRTSKPCCRAIEGSQPELLLCFLSLTCLFLTIPALSTIQWHMLVTSNEPLIEIVSWSWISKSVQL